MTILQLQYFLTIARFGSLSRAAQELFITQPALTRSMRELEKELSISLFHRSGRGIALTSQGETFLYEAKELYRQYEELMDKYTDPQHLKQSFSVSTQHYSFAVQAFVELVRESGTALYEFALKEEKTMTVIQEVSSMRSDLGIVYRSRFNGKVMDKTLAQNSLEFHPLITCRAYVYLHENHPLAIRESVTFEDLDPYICLSFEQGEDSSYYMSEELYPAQNVSRKIIVSDRATMLNLMTGLNGYTICSGIIYQELNGDGYKAVPIEDQGAEEMEIGYIHRRHLALSPLSLRYLEILNDILRPYQSA